jgi:hypothetical protein
MAVPFVRGKRLSPIWANRNSERELWEHETELARNWNISITGETKSLLTVSSGPQLGSLSYSQSHNLILTLMTDAQFSSIILTSTYTITWCEMLRIPHCLDNRLTDGGKVVSPTQWPRSTLQKHYVFCFWYSFLLEAEWTPGTCEAERIRYIEEN